MSLSWHSYYWLETAQAGCYCEQTLLGFPYWLVPMHFFSLLIVTWIIWESGERDWAGDVAIVCWVLIVAESALAIQFPPSVGKFIVTHYRHYKSSKLHISGASTVHLCTGKTLLLIGVVLSTSHTHSPADPFSSVPQPLSVYHLSYFCWSFRSRIIESRPETNADLMPWLRAMRV